ARTPAAQPARRVRVDSLAGGRRPRRARRGVPREPRPAMGVRRRERRADRARPRGADRARRERRRARGVRLLQRRARILRGSPMATDDARSLAEVHRTVPIPTGGTWFRRLFAFAGPAYLVSVGYMDPGNWATDLAGGARFGYQLIWVLLMSNLMAV